MFLICSYSLIICMAMSIALRKPGKSESFPLEIGGVAGGAATDVGPRPTGQARYEPIAYEPVDDGWESLGELEALSTEVQEVPARRIITRNSSPDIGFDRSINPYRGCEHGCIYCFARPTHAFLGLSPGLDFETKLFAKTNAGAALERELADPPIVRVPSPSAPTPTPTSRSSGAIASCGASWKFCRRPTIGRHRHQIGFGAARSRHSALNGRARSRQSRALRYHARPQACPCNGAAREHA